MSGHDWSPEWVSGDGPDADVVISTRARLARSLAAYPFPSRATARDSENVAAEVSTAAEDLAREFPGMGPVSVDGLSQEERAFLLDTHMASAEQLGGGEGRLVLLEPTGAVSIMVNEEDHLRLQALVSGMAPHRAYELVDRADDVLGARLRYGFSDRYGYLTASVSNVGTGLRVSALVHLAGTLASGTLRARLRAAYDLGVSIRGLYGEGTRSMGDLFQVSNEVTLGLSEGEIVERVESVARYLVQEERQARKELMDEGRRVLVDRASKALKALRHSRAMAAAKAIDLMSPLRLAVEVGLASGCSRVTLNEVLAGIRAGAGDGIEANMYRASMLRTALADAHIVGD